MCGRFVASVPPASIAKWLDATVDPELVDLGARYNVAPMSMIAAVNSTERRLGLYRWGLIPAWVKDPQRGARMFNARSETLADKPSFRNLINTHRCVVPMDGFYEWAPAPAGSSTKIPFLIRDRTDAPLFVAGLWTTWQGRDRSAITIRSATIITCEANAELSQLHHRMPVILDADGLDTWLDNSIDDRGLLMSVLRPAADGQLEVHRVSTDVNNARNDGPHLIERSDAAQ